MLRKKETTTLIQLELFFTLNSQDWFRISHNPNYISMWSKACETLGGYNSDLSIMNERFVPLFVEYNLKMRESNKMCSILFYFFLK
jgi:hypothetical protein